MIIVNIIGGLGNQMFQYAFGYALAKKKNEILKFDISEFEAYQLRKYELDKFNIDIEFAPKKEVKKLKIKHILQKTWHKIRRKDMNSLSCYYKEFQFNFDENVFHIECDVYFYGYWQSEKYFKEYRNDLLKQFTLREEIHLSTQAYKQKIIDTESVSLHIRRGDYVTNTKTNSIHGTCSLEYYRKAVLKIEQKIVNPQFFVFSDDLDWAKENLDFINNITFVELQKNIPDHEEMYLMSQCKHNIIANSSFSWWGAWLNQNDHKIVIAPKQWFNDNTIDTSDLIPKDWFCI